MPHAAPAKSAAPAAPAGPEVLLSVPLAALCDSWPEVLRSEIVQLNLSEAHMALPVRFVEPALRQGKVVFSWKVLRSWIRPATLPTVSAHDGMMLELPLRVIAPLFVARQKQAAKGQKVQVDENIPNLFFGFPQGESAADSIAPAPVAPPPAAPAIPMAPPQPVAPAPVAEVEEGIFAPSKPAGVMDTNFYVWNESSDAPQVDESAAKRTSPGTDFLTRYATPNEVVSRAAAMDGVVGALVALPDGLMVASKLSPDLNGDTLAAFLPQIFGKVSQCTKELRMGELNNLHFTVGNVPWKIFRVNAIFFAVFGQPGRPLPTAHLAALAGELDRKK
jgi:predicted regulator of Ras-like GTPase activity (Roadblock/LC7/MglB family)